MGKEARRRQAAREAWLASLTASERTIVDVAESLYYGFVVPRNFQGGCYLLSLFLKAFLETEHRIATDAVLGFVNDGTDEVYTSHAWAEHVGRKTDLALAHPDSTSRGAAGPVRILDRVVKDGWSYQYTTTPPHDPFDPGRFGYGAEVIVAHKQREHERIRRVIEGGPSATRMYFDGAPDGCRYEQLAMIARTPRHR